MAVSRVKYPTDEDIVAIGGYTEGRCRISVKMIPITKEDIEKLKTDGSCIFTNSLGKMIISMSDIYLMGSVDINNKEDQDFVRNPRIKWCSDTHAGSFIPKNYDYKTNTGDIDIVDKGKSTVPMCGYVETFDNWKMLLFGHAKLGYPEFICIFKKISLY